MGKSIRSKTKRAFRAKKRTEGVFAATEAARLQRLNTKLRVLTTATPTTPTGAVGEDVSKKDEHEDDDADMPVEDEGADADAEMVSPTTEGVANGNAAQAQNFTGKISTHGPRGSRRERWRASKGMSPRPKSRGMNRQGTATARYKPGRSHRRR